MKILVFSDTHGRGQPMLNTLAQHEKEINACIFLGDGVNDALQIEENFPHIAVHMVRGNCDYSQSAPAESTEVFGGAYLFLCHGHAYGVKEDLSQLCTKAKQQGACAALYGHTHMPNSSFENGIHIFNPGSICLPRGSGPTYGIINIKNSILNFEICKYVP